MSGRRTRRRCRGCQDEPPRVVRPVQEAASKAAKSLSGKKLDSTFLTRAGESDRLWNHVLFGTSTCVGMIEGYVALGLPGTPHKQVVELIQRLSNVAKQLEAHDAHQYPTERLPGDSPVNQDSEEEYHI